MHKFYKFVKQERFVSFNNAQEQIEVRTFHLLASLFIFLCRSQTKIYFSSFSSSFLSTTPSQKCGDVLWAHEIHFYHYLFSSLIRSEYAS